MQGIGSDEVRPTSRVPVRGEKSDPGVWGVGVERKGYMSFMVLSMYIMVFLSDVDDVLS